ncbi:Crp/Fnr family transcriptional regulator [Shewanella aestuarii]|uniref:Crp/Fnr family transcriptional regulator n=1 Tax=Shewanella aestuarii TaxID=1028752 RepID=A0A6G9QPR5_9GAMM|nr:Crp/Fnr family transcriptional regulator [Shewanella aestuarii]QIR15819.1 Crp/Fnr family transcriptional regulator [Shewanella aestuarii]
MATQTNWIALLPQEIQDEVKAKCKLQTFKDGEYVYRKGDTCTHQYQVVSGSVRFRIIADNGKEATMMIYGPDNCFGYLSVIDKGERPNDVVAVGDTTLARLTAKDFDVLAEKYPIIYKYVIQNISTRLREIFHLYEYGLFFNLERRLANQILLLLPFALSKSHSDNQTTETNKLDLTQEMLASLVGATRQAINKLLKDWADDSIIEYHYGKIQILDIEKLKKISRI